MITDRDIEIFKFINKYGKSYIEVLAKTFFTNEQVARNRMNILAKQNLITYWNTNLMKPRRAIVLTSDTKSMLENDFDITPRNAKLNRTTIQHNIIEQIVDFHLSKIGTVERTTVYTHKEKLHHIPDFIFINGSGNKINIEVELTKKSAPRYAKLMQSVSKDNPDAIIYVLTSKEKIKPFATIMQNGINSFLSALMI
ncbi:hypothetical protein [Sulfurimonas paralvinellae]|uniref:DUF4143 domain-containing protein n=1 Tax=Sulfurimonas paralvinellae TaxID=317658 RepID=A0A7M1B9Y4_9BACT|nr:hypothetical protein [Sulfurimonas paralvinellae]QOP45542.1 hypothetical protein FM071_04290 [Sulfurimonas paralvinellae]